MQLLCREPDLPELPEVEVIARGLKQVLPGLTFQRVECFYSGCIHGGLLAFQEKIPGKKVRNVRRRGKLLIIDLDFELHLIFHLKMTGKILFRPELPANFDKHTHILFEFASKECLLFQDMRKFGYSCLKHSGELNEWDFYRLLGPEPLLMLPDEFVHQMKGKKGRIKSLLLDQKIIAGIGNIYADEALHLARINPLTPADYLQPRELLFLFEALQKVLNKAIVCGGSSFRDYVNINGDTGSYQDGFWVYGRKGAPCKICGSKLQVEKVAGRTSVYCPHCQPLLSNKSKT